jgi:nucleoside-diphosphate-sugar epimerase
MGTTLVTGATGFTGNHLARRLRETGSRVVAFVRPTSDARGLHQIGVESRVVDICHPVAVKKNLSGVDTVFHLAAAFRREHADPEEFQRVNVEATRNLLEASLELKVARFVHCSTVGVQGHIVDPPASEDHPFAPGDHYQESKLKGELLALEYARQGLDVTVVRPAGIYGPGDRRFLKLFLAIAKRRFVMIGSGRTLYHMTYIDDLIDGFLLAASRLEAIGEAYTLAGPTYTTLALLTEQIAEVLGVPAPRLRLPHAPVLAAALLCEKACKKVGVEPPLYPRRVEFFLKDRAFDIAKARRELGYNPKVELREGLERTAGWYRAMGLL